MNRCSVWFAHSYIQLKRLALCLSRQEGRGSGHVLPQRADWQHEGRVGGATASTHLIDCFFLLFISNSTCVCCQPKQLRRLIQQTFQGYSTLNQDQCMVRFFTTLAQCHCYTQESFTCQLVVSVWALNTTGLTSCHHVHTYLCVCSVSTAQLEHHNGAGHRPWRHQSTN